MFSVNNHRYLPENLILRIFSYLNENDLLAVQATCKEGKAWANKKELWLNLFKHYFKKSNEVTANNKPTIPQVLNKKYPNAIFVKDPLSVHFKKLFLVFLCNLKLDQKKSLTIDILPRGSLKMTLLVTLAEKSIEDFVKSTVEKEEYYTLIAIESELDNSSSGCVLHHPSKSKSKAPIDNDAIHYFNNMLFVNTRFEQAIDFVMYDYIRMLNTKVNTRPLFVEKIFKKYLNKEKTLGYLSEINDWKAPIKLIPLKNDQWWGRFPNHFKFKFVLIEKDDKLTSEKREQPRHFCELHIYNDKKNKQEILRNNSCEVENCKELPPSDANPNF